MACRITMVAAMALALLTAVPSLAAERSGGFARWAAVVAAGDTRTTNGKPTHAFENARRDVAGFLRHEGFEDANLRELSVAPPEDEPQVGNLVSYKSLNDAMMSASRRASKGCLLYLTSHGSTAGATLGDNLMTPSQLKRVLRGTCGQRPTIIIISACHSGVFAADEMRSPNRMIFTAARADRTSFGCGEDNVYPYFDACFLGAAGEASDFIDLAERTRVCVAEREAAEKLEPSDPQLFIGEEIEPLLRSLAFAD